VNNPTTVIIDFNMPSLPSIVSLTTQSEIL
jgi:hypothetical protein